jgi:hypothetical protein
VNREKRLTSPPAAVSLISPQQKTGCRMIQQIAVINILSLILIIIAGLIIGDDDKGLVMA